MQGIASADYGSRDFNQLSVNADAIKDDYETHQWTN